MRRAPLAPAAAALALGLLAAALPARAGQAVARPAEGAEVQGVLVEADGKALRIQTDAGGQSFVLQDLMSVEFRDAKAPVAGDCGRVLTAAGDVIPGKAVLGASGRLEISGPWADRFEVSPKDLSGLLMPAGLKDERALREIGRTGRRKDKLVLAGDELEGSFEGLTKDGVKFSSVLGPGEYKMDAVLALGFAELESFKAPEGAYLTAELAGGGRVSGWPVKAEGEKLRWRTLGGLELSLVLGSVSALRTVNGRVVFLADLKPSAPPAYRPFVEGLPFVWEFRADSDVFGKPLVLGGRTFDRGLGVAAHTRLAYALDGKFKRFKAEAGISDSVAAGGKTAFKVLLDGKEVFSCEKDPLTRGAKARSVDLEVLGGKLLELVVDFGPDGSDLGDIGGWGEARLIR